jgi:hypothetical protein
VEEFLIYQLLVQNKVVPKDWNISKTLKTNSLKTNSHRLLRNSWISVILVKIQFKFKFQIWQDQKPVLTSQSTDFIDKPVDITGLSVLESINRPTDRLYYSQIQNFKNQKNTKKLEKF